MICEQALSTHIF